MKSSGKRFRLYKKLQKKSGRLNIKLNIYKRYERYIKYTFHIFDILSYNSLLRGIGLKT